MPEPATTNDHLWKRATDLRPDLLYLYDVAGRIRVDESEPFCANQVWYRVLKPRLLQLVGWEADYEPRLVRLTMKGSADELTEQQKSDVDFMNGPDAYDVCYQRIYDRLPYCRDCGCA